MIKIGISSCFMYPDLNRGVFPPKTLNYLEQDMGRFITQKGILPVLIPNVEGSLLQDLVNEMDGFVFQGGTDVSPQMYGEAPIENGRWKGDQPRDEYELKLMKMAFKTEKPILCVCRGMQLMNVFFGGSLYQDTKTQRPETILHRDASEYDRVCHRVTFSKGSLMEKLYGSENHQINSVHHQSIKELGKNLQVEAISPEDNVIEAIRYTGSEKWMVGVQWHPEFSHTVGDRVISPEPLYQTFLKEVNAQKSTYATH